jgi:hypothetical protein
LAAKALIQPNAFTCFYVVLRHYGKACSIK